MLSPLLGKISNLYIKNSGDLLEKINNLNMENKSLASFIIKSLNTYIPDKKCFKHLEIHHKTNITFTSSQNNQNFHIMYESLLF